MQIIVRKVFKERQAGIDTTIVLAGPCEAEGGGIF